MSRNFGDLKDADRPKFVQLVANCKERGHTMRPFFTFRDVIEQAKLWRQSRSGHEIRDAIKMLERECAPFLANVLNTVGPQYGRWVTNALPGQSWHQWGMAIDCFLMEHGKAVWDTEHEGYEVYAYEAKTLGLHAGYFWPSCDAVHVQSIGLSAPRLSWREVDGNMKELWGNKS